MNDETLAAKRGRFAILRVAALLTAAMLVAGCTRDDPASPATAATGVDAVPHAHGDADSLYRCPMHPDVVRNEPGQCPICGMELTRIDTADPGAESTATEVRITPAVVNNLGVRTEAAVLAALPRRAETVGFVRFDDRRVRQVRPRAEGWIEGLSVRAPGETVEAGQRLFTVYSPTLEAAQQEYLDALRIGNDDLIAASTERLRALGLDAGAVRGLATSGRTAGRVAFHAPVAGVVSGMDIREGAKITPEMTAMEITELGSLWVIAEVPETQAGWVGQGSPAELRFASLPGELIEGRVEHVYPELNIETRTVRARIVLDRPRPEIRANMLARVTLLGDAASSAVTIPRNALIRGGAEDRVVVALGEGRFAPRRVVAGAESGERIAIREGLAAGEQVVVAGQFLLDSEANLRAGFGRLDGDPTASDTPANGSSGASGEDPPSHDPQDHAGH